MRKLQDRHNSTKTVQIDNLFYDIDLNSMSAAVVMAPIDEYVGLDTVVIPAEIVYDGKSYVVDRIATGAFSGCKNLVSLLLPNSIKEIGIRAFAGCSNLTEIVGLPENISICMSAFIDCPLLINRE